MVIRKTFKGLGDTRWCSKEAWGASLQYLGGKGVFDQRAGVEKNSAKEKITRRLQGA